MTRALLLFILPNPLCFLPSSIGCSLYPLLLPSPFGFLRALPSLFLLSLLIALRSRSTLVFPKQFVTRRVEMLS